MVLAMQNRNNAELDLTSLLQPFENCIVIIHDFQSDNETHYLTLHNNKIPIILSKLIPKPYSSYIEFTNPPLFVNKSRSIYINCAIELYLRPPIKNQPLSMPRVLTYLTVTRHLLGEHYYFSLLIMQ